MSHDAPNVGSVAIFSVPPRRWLDVRLADTDTTQLAFEIYSLMLGLHHDSGLFGYDEARQLTERALARLFASYQPPNASEAPK